MKKTIKKITAEPVKQEQEQKTGKTKGCFFCQNKQIPEFTDSATVKRFLSERGKILPKGYTRLCSKHQRAAAKQIKYARHLALLPFTPKV